MQVKELVVHVSNTGRRETLIGIAADIAGRFGARLNGLFADCDPYLANLASRNPEEMFTEAAEQAEDVFRQQTQQAKIDGQWLTSIVRRDSALIRSVLFAARHADLIILGQDDPRDQLSGVPRDLVEQIVLGAGRPVLAIPYIGDYPHIGRRVMVAWNGGREAARAVHDALPFLVGAEEVVLIAVNPDRPDAEHGAVPCADLARHLRAHGVRAETETLRVEELGVMDTLLSRLADRGTDLLVMGAHGHYGFPHLHRGGGTKHILGHMTVPVLLSN